MNIPVVTVGQPSGDFVAGLERLHGPVTVVRRCAGLPELLAACQTGIARAAIIAGDVEELTASLAERLGASGVAVVALTDTATERSRLDSLGIRHAPTGVAAEQLAALITAAVEDTRPGSAGPGPYANASYANGSPVRGSFGPAPTDPSDGGAAGLGDPSDGGAAAGADAGGVGHGQVTAVWGPAGAPGRTTVAVNLAAELAAAGQSVLLVDADTYGASIAGALGLLDESAGLAQACRLADQGMLDEAALERVSVRVAIRGAQVRVLTGITRADRWTEIRPAALARVISAARALVQATVIDCGFCLETDEELSFDSLAPRRNGATLRSLELADTVYAVGAADAIGVPRLVRALAELQQGVPSARPQVLLNKVRASAAGRAPERQLRDAWERYGPGCGITAFLPADPAAADAALLGGSALVEVAPQSPLRRALAALVAAPAPPRRRAWGPGAGHGVKFSAAGTRLEVKGTQRSGL